MRDYSFLIPLLVFALVVVAPDIDRLIAAQGVVAVFLVAACVIRRDESAGAG